MINFEKIDLSRKAEYRALLKTRTGRGCEYALANLLMWGKQRAAFLDGFLVLFSQFNKSSVYPFPVGTGDVKPVLDAILADARERGIVCRITGMSAEESMHLEELYPGVFCFHPDRDGCDYVYRIEDLATLKGRKFQKKRNHVNRFWDNHPNCQTQVLTRDNAAAAEQMIAQWFAARADTGDYLLEQKAISRAFSHWDALDMEGMLLLEDGKVLAVTMGSPLTDNTFDIHFEKALEEVDGAYAAINQAFSGYLWEKYPDLQYLNREDDLGIAGLRKAKLSYNPDHLVVKFWAQPREDDDED